MACFRSPVARLIPAMMVLLLAACGTPRSFDRAVGEEPVYFDQATPEQRDAAARLVGEGLLRGSGTYRLQPGDRVEVFYHSDNQRLRPYRIGIGDELELDFDFNRDLNRTMVVRPDGMISLPGKGEVRAVGLTPAALWTRSRGASTMSRGPRSSPSSSAASPPRPRISPRWCATVPMAGRARRWCGPMAGWTYRSPPTSRPPA